MTAISVIVPVFNAAPQLERCIQSLLAQTLASCEFIFINDGSTDDSRTIIEQFQKTDSRIILINQENQGVSAARNAGLSIARGEYLGFADADDTVNPEFFEKMVGLARENKADVVLSNYLLHQGQKEELIKHGFDQSKLMEATLIKGQVIPYLIASDALNAVWTKIFKRELVVNNQITFPVGMALGEDGCFNLQAFYHAKLIYATDYAGYHYHENEGSATRNFAQKDYFKPITEEYQRDYSVYGNFGLKSPKMTQLKAEKFLSKTLSLLHEYTHPTNKLGVRKAYALISDMLNNPVFRQVITENHATFAAKKSHYGKLILWAARNKWIYLLFLLTAYSRFRNKNN